MLSKFIHAFVVINLAAYIVYGGYCLIRGPVEVIHEQEFIACMRTGCVYCMSFEETPCGVKLSKCADTKEYFCQHDISYKLTP